MSAYTILVVDDVPETASTTAALLELRGFRVYTATNPHDALEILARVRIHLVLLDLCLTGDGDPTNGGLELAEQIDISIPKIIITNFPSFDTLYDARVYPGARQPLVADYILKRLGPEILVERVRKVLADYAPINWQLNVRWSERAPVLQRLSLPRLADLIAVAPAQTAEAAQELGDLLRRLFLQYDEISVERAMNAVAGRAALEIRARKDGQGYGPYFVVYGTTAQVFAYEDARKRYAPRDGDGRALHPEIDAVTKHYAAYGYLLNGVRLSASMVLRDYYREAGAADVTTAVDDLMQHGLRPWFTRTSITHDLQAAARFFRAWLTIDGGVAQPQDLLRWSTAIAQASLAMGGWRIDVDLQTLVVDLSDHPEYSLPLPLGALNVEYLLAGSEQLVGMLNGALTLDNVLIDRERHTCALIEFTCATQGPLYADYVTLEHALRRELSLAVSLEERIRCEEKLLAMPSLTSAPDMAGLTPEAQKMMRAIARTRYQAGKLSPARDINAYHTGLLFAALRHVLTDTPGMQHDDPELLISLAHSLVSAGLIYQRLLPAHAPITLQREQRIVSVYGRDVRLPPQRFRLFAYLYDRRNQPCEKRDLMREALEMPDIVTAADVQRNEGMLHTLIWRLRKQIEPDPNNPLFLQNVRDYGYCLDLPPDLPA